MSEIHADQLANPESSWVRIWPLASWAIRCVIRFNCIDFAELAISRTRLGLFHRRAESPAANVLRFHRPERYPTPRICVGLPARSLHSCHEATADTDFVFTQYYPVLRAAIPAQILKAADEARSESKKMDQGSLRAGLPKSIRGCRLVR